MPLTDNQQFIRCLKQAAIEEKNCINGYGIAMKCYDGRWEWDYVNYNTAGVEIHDNNSVRAASPTELAAAEAYGKDAKQTNTGQGFLKALRAASEQYKLNKNGALIVHRSRGNEWMWSRSWILPDGNIFVIDDMTIRRPSVEELAACEPQPPVKVEKTFDRIVANLVGKYGLPSVGYECNPEFNKWLDALPLSAVVFLFNKLSYTALFNEWKSCQQP